VLALVIMTRSRNQTLIYSSLILAILIIGIIIGYLVAYNKYVPASESTPLGTVKLTGKITDVVDGRPIDGHCFMKINGKNIIVELSGQTTPPDELTGPFGQLIVNGQKQDATCESVAKYKGQNAEVYASGNKDIDIYLSIYGNTDYYVKINP
jgi:hypothetical protein